MTALEKDILNVLTEDARITPKKIAAMLSVEEAQVKACIQDMEKSGLLVKYTAIVNDEKADDSLAALHAKMGYFHIKDVIAETHEIVPAGIGDGKIDRLVAMLPAEGEWVLTLEPHLSLFEGYAAIDNTEMKNKFVFKNNDESFDAATAALKKIIKEQNYTEINGGFTK